MAATPDSRLTKTQSMLVPDAGKPEEDPPEKYNHHAFNRPIS